MKCKKCGNEIPDNAIFCPQCGENIFEGKNAEFPKNSFFDFTLPKTIGQSIGFYFLGVIAIVVVCAIIGGIFGLSTNPEHSYEAGLNVGRVCVFVINIFLGGLFMNMKSFWNNGMAWLVYIFSILAAYFGGAIFCMIFISILFAMNPHKNKLKKN